VFINSIVANTENLFEEQKHGDCHKSCDMS